MDQIRAYMKDLERCRPLTREEELDLGRRAQAGDVAAKHRLVESVLPYALKLAAQWQRRGVPLPDLIQYANFGVIEAVERYDPEVGRLTTYATWWIRQTLHRCLVDTREVFRLPKLSAADERRKLLIFKNSNHLMTRTSAPQSLEGELPDCEGELTLGDILADEHAEDASELSERQDNRRRVRELLGRLSPRHREVLIARSEGETFVQIGARLGVTKERIRQIETAALKKLAEEFGVPSPVDSVASAQPMKDESAENKRRLRGRRKGHV